MPVPKKRSSKTRGKKRRTHWKIKPPHLVECPRCHGYMLPHHVCPHCGYYKGKQVIVVEGE
ncbi:50S ribosomal protein L32 [bacterium]|nr:MAG: 50S ribosomal protein L32 [bacterium]RKZ27229.1 MAG: 50S ribosomal protein L32 [bacterium]